MKRKGNVILPSSSIYQRTQKLYNFIINFIYPKKCPCCGEVIGFNKIDIHKTCYDNLHIIKGHVCKKCGKRLLDEDKEYCDSCLTTSHFFDQGRALYERDKVTRNMIARMKYHNERYISKFLGSELAKNFANEVKKWKIEAIVPVPIHNNRKKTRGFNQSLDLAKEFQNALYSNQNIKIPILPTLVQRKGNTKRQKDLSVMDKRKNLFKAFRVKKIFKIMPKSVLIIDDIYTTGATIDELSLALRSAGVERVYFLAITTGSVI